METSKDGTSGKILFALLVASIVFVAGIFAVSYRSPSTSSATTSRTSQTASNTSETPAGTSTISSAANIFGTFQTYGAGPVSTFPATWDNPCEFPVQGNRTTNVESSLPFGNLSMSQVYYRIVNSSAFKTLAAGRDWVTIDWGGFQLTNRTGSYTVLIADLMFVSGGFPDEYVQMDYFLSSGDVTVGFDSPSVVSTCPPFSSFSYDANLVGSTGGAESYQVGQAVEINLTVSDETTDNMTITSHTSCLGNITVLKESGTNVTAAYASSKHPQCSGPSLNVVLNPRETYSQLLEWNQTDDAGAQVPPGTYQIMASVGGEQGQVLLLAGVVTIDAP